MKPVVLAAALGLGALGTGSALASPRCNVPMANWQPREALQKKVEAEGWKVTRIKTDDGCYEVHATNDQGQRYEGKFDPSTLNPVSVEIDRR
jgi:hypothetical protein